MRNCSELDNPDSKVAVRVNLDTQYEPKDGFQNYSKHSAHSTTLNSLLDNDVEILLLAHLSDEESMDPVAKSLEEFVESPIRMVERGDLSSAWMEKKSDEILLYENLYSLEEDLIRDEENYTPSDNYKSFIDEISSNVDAYVNDCFSLSHLELPSTTGVSKEVPSYAGQFLDSEISFVKQVRSSSQDVKFLFSGTDVSRDLSNIRKILSSISDACITTSGLVSLAFLEAEGYDLGEETRQRIKQNGSSQSIDIAYEILTKHGERVYIPDDVTAFSDGSQSQYALSATPISERIVGVGSETFELYKGLFNNSDLVVANGITNKREMEKKLYTQALRSDHTIVAGSDTISFCDELDLTGFSHTTSNPQPLIQFLSGEELPGVKSLLP